jgi:hypothetical protein
MFLRIYFPLLIIGWFSVTDLVPVVPIYRKGELALKYYISYPSHNPVIHSLLNVLIHDKQARAFIFDQSIKMALEKIKEFDQKTKTISVSFLRILLFFRFSSHALLSE